MRTTSVVEPPRPAGPAPSIQPPPNEPLGFLRGPLIVTGLVGFWTLLLIANVVVMPVRVVRRLVRR